MQHSIDAYYSFVELIVKRPVDQAVLPSGHFDELLDNLLDSLVGDQPVARLMMFPSSTVMRLRLREASTHARWHGTQIAWFLFDARYRSGAFPQSLDDLPATVFASVQFAGEQGLRWVYASNGSDFTLILAGLPGASQQAPATPSEYSIVIWPPVNGPESSSLLDRPLFAEPPGDRTKLDDNLLAAREAREDEPWNPNTLIWEGRRLGYLWRMNDAVDVYSQGIGRYPTHAALFRHRGHRYISLRRFDLAVDDLTRAAELIRGRPEEIEPDGMPNARNIPLTTTGFNVWYHLGLAHYLQWDFERALHAFQETMKHTRGYDDNLVAVTDWTYLTLRRLGRDDEASALLEPISADMDIIENHAYHRRLLMYKGELSPDDLLDDSASPLDLATQGYGVGMWYLGHGQTERAIEIFERTASGPYWPAFGHIAAEVELARRRPALPIR